MKYHILIDYGSEGLSLHETAHDTIDEAVKTALRVTMMDFKIIQIVDWEVIEKTNTKETNK